MSPLLDIVDKTFVVAPIEQLRDELCDQATWAELGVPVRVREDRGLAGVRWDVTGPLRGTSEIWLEPTFGGVMVHLFLQADPIRPLSSPVAHRRFARALKRWVLTVKRGYDAGRPAAELGPMINERTTLA